MIFSEIYSAYYKAVSKMIEAAIEGSLDGKKAVRIIEEHAFSESSAYILPMIQGEQWQVLTKDYQTSIKNNPGMPLSLLQKRWLKTISQDKRMKLFVHPEIGWLSGVEPLYQQGDLEYFDVAGDGDDYENTTYIQNFRTVLKALKAGRMLHMEYKNRKGQVVFREYAPYKLEYSEKDDKFRLLGYTNRNWHMINVGRIVNCEAGEELPHGFLQERSKSIKRLKTTVLVEIRDERNALERALLHFANYEKATTQTGERIYRMELSYNQRDETEILIRILSFGPMLKVLAPDGFVGLIKERLSKQKKLQAF